LLDVELGVIDTYKDEFTAVWLVVVKAVPIVAY